MPVPPPATETAAGAVLTESLTATAVSQRLAVLGNTPASEWREEDLSYYITEEIERLHGPQLPCPHQAKIIAGFWERFGEKGVAIARAAFEAHRGMWMGAPVTVKRFAEGHDEFFSFPLLRETGAAG